MWYMQLHGFLKHLTLAPTGHLVTCYKLLTYDTPIVNFKDLHFAVGLGFEKNNKMYYYTNILECIRDPLDHIYGKCNVAIIIYHYLGWWFGLVILAVHEVNCNKF